MQDRIAGPLTLFQFLYLLAGGMIFYGTLKSQGSIDLIFVGIPVGLFSLALAFVKINDQPFGKFISALIYFTFNPKTRVWHHGAGAPKINLTEAKADKKQVVRKELNQEKIKKFIQTADK